MKLLSTVFSRSLTEFIEYFSSILDNKSLSTSTSMSSCSCFVCSMFLFGRVSVFSWSDKNRSNFCPV